MGQEGVILAELRLDRVRLLILRQVVLVLRRLRQRVRSVDPKFPLADFRVQNPSDSVTEHDSL